ncbi:hypothetical protein MUN89_18940 [Halobacillus salinarum]|uniref:HEAT repeat domain-containing protein n=1 Tax=Halobacillus salinarum TaxID=2932257 RepID=A0ABY4EJX1_9BACI|nr:hypothetical protein [Halobacillus salinarum]UOQ43919.1 hypothetical protein MUN89_18940 [Halobacillus salinarum]
MFVNLELAMGMAVILLTLMAVIMAITLTIKIGKIRKEKKTQECLQKHQNYLDYVQTAMDLREDIQPPASALNKFERKVFQQLLSEWINRLSGIHKEKLIQLCEDMGLTAFNLKRLNSSMHINRIDAAYYLGTMRHTPAVPHLFTLLRKNKFDSTIYIIGRSIAQASEKPEEVGEMLEYLADGKKSTYQLLADIAKEASVDLKECYFRFLTSQNPALIKVGLIGLRDEVGPEVPASVRKLMTSNDKATRMLTIQILTASMALSAKEVVTLAKATDDQVRMLIFEWIGETEQLRFTELLEEGLHSRNLEVARTCAKSLLGLGNVGFSILCKAALETDSASGSKIALDAVHEELDQYENAEEDVEQLNHFNQKQFLYKKFFGKDRSLVEAI